MQGGNQMQPFLAVATATRTATTVGAAAALAVCTVAVSVAGGMMALAAAVPGIQRQGGFQIAAVEAGPADRDPQRLAHMRQLQAAQELYYDNFLAFPVGRSSPYDSEIGHDLNCLSTHGWFLNPGCWGQMIFLDPAPRDPLTEIGNVPCIDAPIPCNYVYRYPPAASLSEVVYEIHFRLEAASGGLSAGLNCTTESGIGAQCLHSNELYLSHAGRRDEVRRSHIRQVQTALEVYFTDQGAYPYSRYTPNENEIGDTNELRCMDWRGWRVSSCSAPIYLESAPREPIFVWNKPCSPTNAWPCNYVYQGPSGRSAQYEIHFALETASGGLPAGLNCATERGIGFACDHTCEEHVYYRDADGDGNGNPTVTSVSCVAPSGYVAVGDDCNDADAKIKPGAVDICDGKDNDCDVTIDEGSNTCGGACVLAPSVGVGCDVAGILEQDTCTDDAFACSGLNATVCNDIDNDADNDGYSRCSATCTVSRSCDCNDTNFTIRPNLPELCDGRDNNCNGSIDESCVTFRRGDANIDGQVTIADVSYISNWLSLGGPRPRCMDAADGNDDGRVDISDLKFISTWYSSGGKVPPPPGPHTKGIDPTADQLDCLYYP